jgi:hypothetical protein
MTNNERVLNWSRWAKDRLVIPVSCVSLESNYRSPQVWEMPELKALIDVNDALRVEKIITAPTFPRASMACIVYSNVYPSLNFHAALRKINRFRENLPSINRKTFADFEKQSLQILLNRINK